ncbi:hypothetical protein D3C80_2119180 [compost metagenome]
MQPGQQAAQIGFGGGTEVGITGRVLPLPHGGEKGADAALAHGEAVHLHLVLVVGKDVVRLHGVLLGDGRPVSTLAIDRSAV